MVQLIKKGGLRERANRSRRYENSENQQTTLKPNIYQKPEACIQAIAPTKIEAQTTITQKDDLAES